MTDKNKNQENQDQEIDRHLQAPGEANRDKHINFRAIEAGDPDPSMEDDSRIHSTEKSTQQTREEKDRDNATDPREDRTINVSKGDLHDAKAERRSGREE